MSTNSGLEFSWDRLRRRFWIDWSDESSFEEAVFCLLGLVLGFFLRREGTVCFHGSALNLRGRGVAFLGPSGAGKSTTAAALARLGHRILSEELIALKQSNGDFLIQPAYPRIRLSATSVEMLYGSADALPPLGPGWGKRYLDLCSGPDLFQSQPLPLEVIYVLGPRTADTAVPYIQPLSGAQALMELVANTYVNSLLDGEMRSQELRNLGEIAHRVRLYRLVPHSSPEKIAEMCDLISGHVAGLN